MTHSWKEKIDQEGLKLVELSAKLRQLKPQPSTLDQREWRRWIKSYIAVHDSYPELELKKKVKLTPEFVRVYVRTNPDIELNEEETMLLFEREQFPVLRADELELQQRIFFALEASQETRFKIYGAVASAIVFLRKMFSGGLKRQLGTKTPNRFQFVTAIAQNLRWLGGALRGNLKPPPGRVDVARAEFIDSILEHQKDPLTQMELYDLLIAAGADLPEDPEAFRLWLHRARKQGLVKNYRSTHSKKNEE
jgi:hypothetical protein